MREWDKGANRVENLVHNAVRCICVPLRKVPADFLKVLHGLGMQVISGHGRRERWRCSSVRALSVR
jgi:hypothetical protein